MRKLRIALRRWYEHSFRDARATFFTITGAATYVVVILGLGIAVAVLLH